MTTQLNIHLESFFRTPRALSLVTFASGYLLFCRRKDPSDPPAFTYTKPLSEKEAKQHQDYLNTRPGEEIWNIDYHLKAQRSFELTELLAYPEAKGVKVVANQEIFILLCETPNLPAANQALKAYASGKAYRDFKLTKQWVPPEKSHPLIVFLCTGSKSPEPLTLPYPCVVCFSCQPW